MRALIQDEEGLRQVRQQHAATGKSYGGYSRQDMVSSTSGAGSGAGAGAGSGAAAGSGGYYGASAASAEPLSISSGQPLPVGGMAGGGGVDWAVWRCWRGAVNP